MRNKIALFLLCATTLVQAQTEYKELKFGMPFTIQVPGYMTRTIGLNDDAVLQFKNGVKDVYGIIIEDNKEELVLADLNYASIDEYTESLQRTFLKDQPTRVLSVPVFKKVGDVKFAEIEASYVDPDENIEIFYVVGLAETKGAFYKILLWTSGTEKEKYKDDFKKALYTFKPVK